MTFILSTISPNVAQADTAKSAAPLSSALCLPSGFTSQTRTRDGVMFFQRKLRNKSTKSKIKRCNEKLDGILQVIQCFFEDYEKRKIRTP